MGENMNNGQLQTLIDDARGGSPAALGELVDCYRRYLLLTANRKLPANLHSKVAPSDVVQDTVLDVVREFPQFSGSTAREFFGWLQRILQNNLTDVCRSFRGSQKRDLGREAPLDRGSSQGFANDTLRSREQSPSTCAVARESAQQVEQALRRLHEQHRAVIRMRNIEGLSFPLIAERMGRSADAARKMWVTAIERLQTELEMLDEFQ
jgi:RNA polymerase sigma-70 factor (ECF subfamily)